MENINNQIKSWFLTKKSFYWFYSFSLIFTGIIYILYQFYLLKSIYDSLFIGLLYGGSFILLIGIKWIQVYFDDKISTFYSNLDVDTNLNSGIFESLTKKIFRNPLTIIAGIGYGIAIGCVPILLNIWENSIVLNILLSLFLFIVNFLTGASLFSLIMLFVFLYKTSSFLKIGLYNRYNTSTNFITDLSKRASIIASFYIAFSITSIYFSELPINSLTIGYSIFAAIIILIAYIVPMIPIRNKLQIQKKETIEKLSVYIQDEFDKQLHNAKSNNMIDTERYNSLIELK
ncbi:MAG: hypothetical protein JXB49_18250, partial [Bacteroidales bacterium]|nr:hypothetical protein [Bacteroidales bacterium]